MVTTRRLARSAPKKRFGWPVKRGPRDIRQFKRIQRLRACGMSYGQIAEAEGTSRQWVEAFLRRHSGLGTKW
jgi:hypothetical protein